MNTKKVLSFLLLKPAFTSRNLTSIALVALFFGVYVAAGGKVSALPKVKQGVGFGAASVERAQEPVAVQRRAPAPTQDPTLRGRLFDDSDGPESPILDDVIDSAPDEEDDLSSIEQRLRMKK